MSTAERTYVPADGQPPETMVEKINPIEKRGITEAQWYTLRNSLYPGARLESVILVWDYCKARGLDPLKKPCHIVPMEVKEASTGKYEWRDVVMPGIYELRTTAQRTGSYLGHSEPCFGEDKDYKGVKAPEWCSMTFYRHHPSAKVEFPVRVYFREVVALNKEGKPNARWARAPIQMLTKCAEAAGLREAFPDEIGGEHTEEEMAGQRAIDVRDEVQLIQEPKRKSLATPTDEPAAKPSGTQDTPKADVPLINMAEQQLVLGIAGKKGLTDEGLLQWLFGNCQVDGGVGKIPKDVLDDVCKKINALPSTNEKK